MELIQTIRAQAPQYGSIPFWSWNDRLEPDELRRQIQRMHELGMRGFFMHARGGLETAYLSDDWFRCVDACIGEAKRLGMEAWAYDENGWPSGFAGGKLLTGPENYAAGLRLLRSAEMPALTEDVLGVYVLEDGKLRQVAGRGMEPCETAAEEYLTVQRYYDFSYVDTMNREVTEKFIAATYEVYRRRIAKEDFGRAMPGFFTDEPQYFRWGTSYSDTLPEKFQKRYGYSLYPRLAALFLDCEGAEEFRYDYWRLCHETFINSFIRPIYEWCNKNGVQITGHAVEETSLEGQMACCGGVMPFYEYEHIPGIDYLGRDIADDIASKQLGSVCAQLGKRQALSEMFACCGWDVSPVELKRIAELQYANGINLMCQHLYPYSDRGQRKRDYPCHYSEHNPWQSHLQEFGAHFNHLGAALAQGTAYAPVLVIHPMHSAYLYYEKEPAQGLSARSDRQMKRLEERFTALSRLLGECQIPYHYGDEWLMSRYASVENGRIRVGQCVYSAVILPDMDTLDRSTAALLQRYLADGGKLWCFGSVPDRIDGRGEKLDWLHASCTFADIARLSPVRVRPSEGTDKLRTAVRETEAGELVFLTNIGGEDIRNVRVLLENASCCTEIDVETLETRPVQGEAGENGAVVMLSFMPGECHLLWLDGKSALVPIKVQSAAPAIRLTGPFALTQAAENQMTLDRAELSTDGVHFDTLLPIEGIRDNLLARRYEGRVWLRFPFRVETVPQSLSLAAEPARALRLTVNGREADFLAGEWRFDRSFRCAEILPFVHPGENAAVLSFAYAQREEVYRVLYGGGSESLRNCLSFDTEVECATLYGQFAVHTDGAFNPDVRDSLTYAGSFAVTRQPETVDLRCPVKDGYPFFAGSLEAETAYRWSPGMPTMLAFTGRFAAAQVSVNGQPAGQMLFAHRLELAPYLQPGENRIRIRLTCANRNLMGPHHRKDPEPYGVGPGTFSFEKEWNGRECPAYQARYAFVRFGIE